MSLVPLSNIDSIATSRAIPGIFQVWASPRRYNLSKRGTRTHCWSSWANPSMKSEAMKNSEAALHLLESNIERRQGNRCHYRRVSSVIIVIGSSMPAGEMSASFESFSADAVAELGSLTRLKRPPLVLNLIRFLGVEGTHRTGAKGGGSFFSGYWKWGCNPVLQLVVYRNPLRELI